MATALDIIRRAMRLCGALDASEVPSAVDAQTGLEAMQAMLGNTFAEEEGRSDASMPRRA